MNTLLNAGQRIVNVLEALRRKLAPLTDPVLDRLAGPLATPSSAREAGLDRFEQEADAVMSTEGTRGAQKLVRGALLVTVLLIVWASFAKIDEVTKGEAKVIPSKQLQVIQSFDGGVVSEILVREGQVVEAGAPLLRTEAA